MNAAAASQAALILFREGLEAMLVITALAAYLVRVEARGALKVLYAGVGAAILASLVMAWIFEHFFGGVHNDLVEGIVLGVTAVLLVYVSGWLFRRADVAQWKAYIATQAAAAVGTGRLTTLGFVAFLAVFREGAETVLFLHAVAAQTGGWSLSILAGLGLGVVILVGLYFLLKSVAVHLPLKPFFLGTAVLLYLMALLFVGQALQEFQEMGWVSVTDAWLPGWLIEFGANPSVEALGLQALLVALIPVVILWNRKRPEGAGAAGETPRSVEAGAGR